jgi:hypothetical protein
VPAGLSCLSKIVQKMLSLVVNGSFLVSLQRIRCGGYTESYYGGSWTPYERTRGLHVSSHFDGIPIPTRPSVSQSAMSLHFWNIEAKRKDFPLI